MAFGRLILYRASSRACMHFCGENNWAAVLASLYMPCMYVMAQHAKRLETFDGQLRCSHQNDQGDGSSAVLMGRTNDSNAEMMVNVRVIRPPCTFLKKTSVFHNTVPLFWRRRIQFRRKRVKAYSASSAQRTV
jgi:hypothetical protein